MKGKTRDIEITESMVKRFHLNVLRPADTGCWLWVGTTAATGYGTLKSGQSHYLAHRVSYVLHCGPIPDGLHIDHLCRVRCCVNPDHLEPVTIGENTRRGRSAEVTRARYATITHCPQGHEYTEENTYYYRQAGQEKYLRRSCRACCRQKMRNRRSGLSTWAR